jgi:hypothetical protein
MDSPVTLHDFVLNLLSDADARTSFQLDPDAALQAAGLSDVTAADVHDAIPLVVDYIPANATGLSGLPDLTAGSLGTDRAGAIHELQAVTSQLPLTGLTNSDLTLAAAGNLTGAGAVSGSGGYTDLSGNLTGTAGPLTGWGGAGFSSDGSWGVGAGVGDDFSSAHDLGSTLDAGSIDPTGSVDPTGTVTGVTGTVTDSVGSPTGGLTSGLDTGSLLDHTGVTGGDLTGGLTGGGVPGVDAATGLVHGVPGVDTATGLVPGVLPATDTATGLLSGADPRHGTDPLHLGGGADASGDASGSAHGTADSHLLDVTHLL